MPEYLAPGVYVEEVSFRSKSIEGVGTTTTGFVGPARYGPTDLDLEIVTSLGDFERMFGDGQPLVFDDGEQPNYLWHATRALRDKANVTRQLARSARERGTAEGVAAEYDEKARRDEEHAERIVQMLGEMAG